MSNRPNTAAHRPKTAPKTAPKMAEAPFDASALLAEISKDPKGFTLGGETFQLPHPSTWGDEVIEAADRNDLVAAAHLILGDQYDRFKEAGGNASFLQRLILAIHGADMGESLALSPS